MPGSFSATTRSLTCRPARSSPASSASPILPPPMIAILATGKHCTRQPPRRSTARGGTIASWRLCTTMRPSQSTTMWSSSNQSWPICIVVHITRSQPSAGSAAQIGGQLHRRRPTESVDAERDRRRHVAAQQREQHVGRDPLRPHPVLDHGRPAVGARLRTSSATAGCRSRAPGARCRPSDGPGPIGSSPGGGSGVISGTTGLTDSSGGDVVFGLAHRHRRAHTRRARSPWSSARRRSG